MDHSPAVDPAEVVRDLKALRRGAALLGVNPRIGPALAAICGADPEAVRARLGHVIAGYPAEQRAELAAAFGIDRLIDEDQYGRRVKRLAADHHLDPRTVRRHIDRAIDHIAGVLAGHAPAAPVRTSPWSTEELRVAVVLAGQGDEVFEMRRVKADRDGLAELDLAVTARRADLRMDVLYGGLLREAVRESSGRTGYVLSLPHALRRGELHEYATRMRLAPTELKPYFVCVPRYPVARFDLRVRFPTGHRPTVRLLNGVFQRDVDDPQVRGEELTVDRVGDVHARFALLTPGLAFGMRWTPAH